MTRVGLERGTGLRTGENETESAYLYLFSDVFQDFVSVKIKGVLSCYSLSIEVGVGVRNDNRK